MKNNRATFQLIFALAACAPWSQLAAAVEPEPGLVASYPFNRNARDTSGFGNHGVASGAVLTEDRFLIPRQAYAFSGENSRIRIANKPSLNVGLGGMTLSSWVYPTRFTGSGERRTILRKMDAAGGTGGYILSLDNSGVPQFGFRPDAANYFEVQGTAALPANQWSHLAATYDGALVKLFVNGVETTSSSQSAVVGPSTAPLIFGQRGWTNHTDNFYGALDEVRIYNYAMPGPDVTQLFRTQNNQAPEARIVVMPRSAFPGLTEHVLISANGEPVDVTLNGKGSEDPDGELEYAWYQNGNFAGTGVVTTVTLPLGSHPITLEVTDGVVNVQEDVTISVVTDEEALGILRAMVESAGLNPGRARNLISTLDRAAQDLANNRLHSRIVRQLTVFQSKVQAQLGRSNPRLASQLLHGARAIIKALNRG